QPPVTVRRVAGSISGNTVSSRLVMTGTTADRVPAAVRSRARDHRRTTRRRRAILCTAVDDGARGGRLRLEPIPQVQELEKLEQAADLGHDEAIAVDPRVLREQHQMR